MLKLAARIGAISTVLSVLTPVGAHALSADGAIRTAGDWLELCEDHAPASSAASGAACRAYAQGAIEGAELMHAADRGGPLAPLFCAPANVTNNDFIAAIRELVLRHPERRDYPAATVIVGGGAELFPCRKPAPTPHRRKRRR